MTDGNEALADQTFSFLKQALSQDEAGFRSLRGPHSFTQGEWNYTYMQEGDIDNFSGYEEIRFQDRVAFFHRAIGGTVTS